MRCSQQQIRWLISGSLHASSLSPNCSLSNVWRPLKQTNMAHSDVDLAAPFENDVILEVRRSKMKTMPGLKIQSGIDKTPCEGRIAVSFLGLEEDEHDLVFHGGRDKAVHGCACRPTPSPPWVSSLTWSRPLTCGSKTVPHITLPGRPSTRRRLRASVPGPLVRIW